MDRQIIRVPFTRLDEKKRTVYGYASTGRVDTYDTIFEPSWWPQAVIGYKGTRTISAMHMDLYGEPMIQTGREPMVVGTVPILECDERGLWIGAEVRDDDTWTRIETGEYNGFSIAAMPYEYREEFVDGRNVIRFTKYHLTDITVGYPAANLDARFQLIERLAMDAESPWDWDWTADADAIVAQLGWEGLAQACVYLDPSADPHTKAAYKLPVMKLKEGTLCLYWNGVRAAMARLLGGGGAMDIPDDERKKIYKKLVKLYKKFDKEPPEFRLDITDGGIGMNAFVKAVFDVVKRLSGREPDAQAVQEIQALETRLTSEKDQQVATLTETVKGLTERLEKLEKPADPPAAGADPKDAKIAELTGAIKGLTERLDAVEKVAARSQQPPENGGNGGGNAPNMDTLIRGRLK